MTTTHPTPETLIPLTPAVFHILLALADGEKHGYGIMQEVMTITQGEVKMGPGTLYGTIKRLLEAGLIEESDERPDPALDDERRRYYRITDFGGRVASAESRRLAALLGVAQAKKAYGDYMTMNKIQNPRLLVISEQVYALLLVLYPAAYRQEYGRHMLQVFRDICRDSYRTNGAWGVVELWLSALLDLFITVIEQHRQEGIRMPTYILSRFSGLILMVAGVLAGFVSISQLQPGSHYSFYGIYKLSIDTWLPAHILLGLGLVGLSLRYKRHLNRNSRAFLLIALLAALTSGLGWNINWNLLILGWFVHFLFIALLGFSLRRQNILAPYNIVMMLLGAIPFTMMLSALVISTRTGGSDGPQWGAFAVMLGIGLGWLIIGYGVHSEVRQSASALA